MPVRSDNKWLEIIATNTEGGGGTAATIADGADSTQGAIADAAVAAGASGTISAKLRRLTTDLDAIKTSESTLVTNTTGLATASTATGATSDAAVTTDTTGTISGKLRGIVAILASVRDSVNGFLKVGLANSLDEDIDSITSYTKGAQSIKLSADGIVSAVGCVLIGYYVEASSSGVISLYDNASAATGNTMLANSKTVAANDIVIPASPIVMTNGVYFDLVSGTATVYILTRKLTNQQDC